MTGDELADADATKATHVYTLTHHPDGTYTITHVGSGASMTVVHPGDALAWMTDHERRLGGAGHPEP